MDYDEFSNDNNPFAGSNHFYSNGISTTIETGEPQDSDTSGASLGVQSLDSQPLVSHMLAQSSDSANVLITNYEVLRDFKNITTVFYKIEYMSNSVLRRYTDFVFLRSYLTKLFQTKVIPPIPEKHSLGRLIKNPFTYKSDTKIIYRRIRLLQYFLTELISDPEIKQAEVFVKFLDSSQRNWLQMVKSGHVASLSSKSVLLTSPRNPTIPNPYLVYLPVPPLGLAKKYDSSLNSRIFVPLEKKAKLLLQRVQVLEQTSKKLIKDFEKNRLAMVELGGFFNIFSILEDQQKHIEDFGNRIDLTFLNIEILTKSITVKIYEPLIILRLTLVAILHLLHYRKLKELQLSYLQEIIVKKQIRLRSLMERVTSEFKLNQVLHNNSVDSPSLNRAINELKIKKQKRKQLDESSLIIINEQLHKDDDDESFIRDHDNNSTLSKGNQGNWKTAIAGTSSSASSNKIHTRATSSHKSVSKLTPDELGSEMCTARLELSEKLTPCFTNLMLDVKYISLEAEKNVNHQLAKVIQRLHDIMSDWQTVVFSEFAHSCRKIWSNDTCLS
ncbi:hypothetical protein KL938_000320 [Ogataea parapolymorpha]|nr:hypothetical protein KL938_000320 [Ogataea parapolymorpha]